MADPVRKAMRKKLAKAINGEDVMDDAEFAQVQGFNAQIIDNLERRIKRLREDRKQLRTDYAALGKKQRKLQEDDFVAELKSIDQSIENYQMLIDSIKKRASRHA